VVDDVEMAIGPTTTLKIDKVEREEEPEAEAVVVPEKRGARGVGKPKGDRTYDTDRSNSEMEVEDTTLKQRKSSPKKKRKKSTLDPTAKKW
jgi:hypothetical protein